MKNNMYINILGWMINELKLKGNELLLYAIIYGYSQDGYSTFKGSLTYIEKALGLSRPTIISLLKKLIEEGYIEKEKESEYKVVKKFNYPSKESLLEASKETLPNINNNINININNICADEIFDYYISKTDIPSQYRYPSATKLYLVALLKEYTKEELLLSIDNYFEVTELKYRKSPKYFFSNSKRSDSYRIFEGFLSKNKSLDKPKIRTNLIDDFIP